MSCRWSRSELEQQRGRQQPGADKDTVAHVVPGSMPPRCATCHRCIEEHRDHPDGNTAIAIAPPDTTPLTTTEGTDHRETQVRTIHRWLLIPMAILTLVGIGMVIGYAASGLLLRAPGIIGGPCIFWLIAGILSFRPRQITVTVTHPHHHHYDDHHHRPPTALPSMPPVPGRLEITHVRTCYPRCFTSTCSVEVTSIHAVEVRNVWNNCFQKRIVFVVVDGVSVVGPRGGSMELEVDVVPSSAAPGALLGWQQFLGSIREDHVGC